MTADLLDRVLAAADPAEGVTARRDTEALLDDILHAGHESVSRGRRPRRHVPRLVLGAAGALAMIAVPVLNGGGNAYAGWTAYPAALSTGQSSAVARQCQQWARTVTRSPTEVVLSERRGDIGLAVLTGPRGLLITCSETLGRIGEASGGMSEAYLTREPDADQILSDGGSGFSEDDGEPIFRVVSGRVGADVAGVLVHTAEQGDVIASVDRGYFTAWWPGPPDSSTPPGGGLPMDFTFTAQLRDGTTKDFDRSETQ